MGPRIPESRSGSRLLLCSLRTQRCLYKRAQPERRWWVGDLQHHFVSRHQDGLAGIQQQHHRFQHCAEFDLSEWLKRQRFGQSVYLLVWSTSQNSVARIPTVWPTAVWWSTLKRLRQRLQNTLPTSSRRLRHIRITFGEHWCDGVRWRARHPD